MRIVAAPVAQVMPVAGKAMASVADFGAMLADAGGETADEDGVEEDAVVAGDPAVGAAVPVAVPVPAVPVMPVMQALPPPAGGRGGVGGDGLVVSLPVQDGGSMPKVSVPTAAGDPDAVIAGRSPSPQPSPRGGAGASVAPVADVAPVSDVAPAGAVMRDVSALLAVQPAPVAVLPPVAQAVALPPVGVAEAAIREQVAALVAADDAPDVEVDTGGDAVAVAAMPATTLLSGTITAPIAPVLSVDGALGLHVAAARAGQELDGITRDIAATNGSSDAPMRFRLDPAALGPVMVEVARGLDGLAVRIEARDGGARDLIADQQPRLMTDARAAGVQISTVQVEARREDVASSASSYQQAGGQQQSASGQSGQRPAPPVPAPVPGWTGPLARAADTGTGPRAASELYA